MNSSSSKKNSYFKLLFSALKNEHKKSG